MEQKDQRGRTTPRRDEIDWENDDAPAIDGFTVGEIGAFILDSVVEARCAVCEVTHTVEPDARDYRCPSCGSHSAVTSPLVKLGLI